MEIINEALKEFGASLTEEGLIAKGNRVIPSIQVEVVKNRIRFVNRMNGDLVMSGPVSKRTVSTFVKKFWFWEKIKC